MLNIMLNELRIDRPTPFFYILVCIQLGKTPSAKTHNMKNNYYYYWATLH